MAPMMLAATGQVVGQWPVPAPNNRVFYTLALEDEKTDLARHVKTFVENRHHTLKVIIKGNDLPRHPQTNKECFHAGFVAWNASDQQLAETVRECNEWFDNRVFLSLPDPQDEPDHQGPILFIYFYKIDREGPPGYKFAMMPYAHLTIEGAEYGRYLADTIGDVMALASKSEYKHMAIHGYNRRRAADMEAVIHNSRPYVVYRRDFIYN